MNRTMKGYKKQPPVSMGHVIKARQLREQAGELQHELGRELGVWREGGDDMGEK